MCQSVAVNLVAKNPCVNLVPKKWYWVHYTAKKRQVCYSNAWINSCGYHPPRAIPPGFVFFLQECSKFPTPGTLKLDNSPLRGIAYWSLIICTFEKKINYLPSKIGFNFCKLFFSNHSPTNSQDFPEKASWIEPRESPFWKLLDVRSLNYIHVTGCASR
jgi:hypothetical protein